MKTKYWSTLGSGNASSEGRAIRQVELLSNKLLTTAFEASLGCVAVMRRAKRRQRGSRDSYRAPKYQQTRASTLWSEGKTICGFIVKVRFHTALRCRKELFMLYKDCTSTGESLYFLYFREKKQSMLTQPKEEKQRKYRQSDGFIVCDLQSLYLNCEKSLLHPFVIFLPHNVE